jgi:hypothetical protein
MKRSEISLLTGLEGECVCVNVSDVKHLTACAEKGHQLQWKENFTTKWPPSSIVRTEFCSCGRGKLSMSCNELSSLERGRR